VLLVLVQLVLVLVAKVVEHIIQAQAETQAERHLATIVVQVAAMEQIEITSTQVV
jgi:hypothetical protein